MKLNRWFVLPVLLAPALANCDGDSTSDAALGASHSVQSSPSSSGSNGSRSPHLSAPSIITSGRAAPISQDALLKAKKLRSWAGTTAVQPMGNRPVLKRKEGGPSPAGPGVWLEQDIPEAIATGAEAAPAASSPRGDVFTLATFRARLHALELGRFDDISLPDYQGVLQHAAIAARVNQHVNYVPLVGARVRFARPDQQTPPRDYFAIGPQKSVNRSQIVTFGLRPEFLVTNVGMLPASVELRVLGRTFSIPLGGDAVVAFPGAGTYHVVATARFSDGAVHVSHFDFEVQPLPDGSYFNSAVDDRGVVSFKISARGEG